MEDAIFTAEASPPENASASPPPVSTTGENAQSMEQLQGELQALKNAFSEFARQNLPEIDRVKQQLRDTAAERDNVAGELKHLRRQNAISSLAAQYGFTDPEYLDFMLQKHQIEPDKNDIANAFMLDLKKSNPRYFALPIKPGSGSRPGNAPVTGGSAMANCRMDALEELLSSAPEII